MVKVLKCQHKEVKSHCGGSCGLLAIGDMHVTFQGEESGTVMQGDWNLARLGSGERFRGPLGQSGVLPSLDTLEIAKKIKVRRGGRRMSYAIALEKRGKRDSNLAIDWNNYS